MKKRALAVCLLLIAGLACSSVVLADEFEVYHPDQHFRKLGFDAWTQGNHEVAVKHLTTAARYAEKGAQLGLAFEYWSGNGVAQDRALAYVWADIAAERGYPEFLAARDAMWSDLTPEEQARAKDVGPKLMAEYGDARAKKRLEGMLRQGKSHKTGTRTGSRVSSVSVTAVDDSGRAAMTTAIASANAMIPAGASAMGMPRAISDKIQATFLASVGAALSGRASGNYYSDANWEPKAYWTYQDALWSELTGVVEVGPLKQVKQ